MTRRVFLVSLTALLALAALPGVPLADEPLPSAEDLLSRIDANMTYDTRSSRFTMSVTKNGRVKSYEAQSYGRGKDDAAVEFLSPPRDAGTRMLKKGDELWMYLPSIEKVQRISGHMLRQGLMGSDFSYEDMMEANDLRSHYKAVVTGKESKDGRPCFRVEMTALSADVTYSKRISWIDAEHYTPVREELYAVSGMMIKVISMSDVKPFGGRSFPTKMVAEDKLQAGSKTEMTFMDMSFSVAVPEEVFSQRWLER